MTTKTDRRNMDMTREEWLKKTGLKPSIGTELAYLIITGSSTFARTKEQMWNKYTALFDLLLFMPSDGEGTEAILSWRLPILNLNLMQLAVLCCNKMAVRRLKRFGFLKPELYKEEGGIFKNHPLHLAYFLKYRSIVEFLRVQRSCFIPEGWITVYMDSEKSTPDDPVVPLCSPFYGFMSTYLPDETVMAVIDQILKRNSYSR